MAVTITEDTGTITVTGVIEARSDLTVATELTATQNLIVSGDLHVGGSISESGDSASYFNLEVLNVPADAATHCYTVAPHACKIIEVVATLVESITAGSESLRMESGAIGPSVLGQSFGTTSPLGYGWRDSSLGADYTLALGDVIELHTAGGATGGKISVSLICRQTVYVIP